SKANISEPRRTWNAASGVSGPSNRASTVPPLSPFSHENPMPRVISEKNRSRLVKIGSIAQPLLVDEIDQRPKERAQSLARRHLHVSFFEQIPLLRQFDAPLLVRWRTRRQLIEKTARPHQQPRLIALLLHHRVRQIELVLRPRDRDVEEPPLLLLAV